MPLYQPEKNLVSYSEKPLLYRDFIVLEFFVLLLGFCLGCLIVFVVFVFWDFFSGGGGWGFVWLGFFLDCNKNLHDFGKGEC